MAKRQSKTETETEGKTAGVDAIPSTPATIEGETVTQAETPATGSPIAALADNMSPPNADAIAAVKESEQGNNADTPAETATDTPKRGRGRPKGSGKSRLSNLSAKGTKDNVASSPQGEVSPEVILAAGTAAQMTVLTGVMIGGDEFLPGPNKMAGGMNDADLLRQVYLDYFKAQGVTKLSPGWALVMGLAIYAAPRFTQPVTQSRAKIALLKLREILGKGINKIFKRKSGNAAHVDSGNDEKRKIDTRETAGA